MGKIHEHIACMADVKQRADAVKTELYHAAKKTDLYSGIKREYHRDNDDGENMPAESSMPRRQLDNDILDVAKACINRIDVEATLSASNQKAFGTITLADGTVLASDVPVTALLTLEKELHDVRTFYSSLPTLRTDIEWKYNESTGQYWSPGVRTIKTKKTQMALTLVAPTPEHPGQAQLISEDVKVGEWETNLVATAISLAEKKAYLERINAVLDAVKRAREQANSQELTVLKVGADIFNYINGQ